MPLLFLYIINNLTLAIRLMSMSIVCGYVDEGGGAERLGGSEYFVYFWKQILYLSV